MLFVYLGMNFKQCKSWRLFWALVKGHFNQFFILFCSLHASPVLLNHSHFFPFLSLCDCCRNIANYYNCFGEMSSFPWKENRKTYFHIYRVSVREVQEQKIIIFSGPRKSFQTMEKPEHKHIYNNNNIYTYTPTYQMMFYCV